MSDLIDKQVVLDTIHRFFTEEVDKIPTKKTEDGEVLVIHKCQPLFEMNKTICKRIKALQAVNPQEPKTDTWSIKDVADTFKKHGLIIEQEPCDDAISRQAVLDALYKLCNTNETLIENPWRDNPHIDALIDAIEELPSVNPQEPTWVTGSDGAKIAFKDVPAWKVTKICEILGDVVEVEEDQEPTGHWEWLTEDKYRCSNCNSETRVDECMNLPMYEFCPFCGAKMAESEEV